MIGDPFRTRFGSYRGFVRLALAHVQRWTGRGFERRPRGPVRRLVFVCQGNICRSAFAHAVAARAGMRVASFGLSTTAGLPAHPPAAAAAAALGVDLAGHRTVRVEAFEPADGDLLLGMEVRHLAALAADPRLAHLPRLLLGGFARPAVPHLHDPFRLDDAYMARCLTRIGDATARLSAAFPGARAS